MPAPRFDAVVVGAGPNGLSAAIRLQQAGLSVLVLEAAHSPGGGARSAALTLPGFLHDVCSAVHPLTAASPFFRSLDLSRFGLAFIDPPLAAAHPLDDGTAAVLARAVDATAASLGEDGEAYTSCMSSFVDRWPALLGDLLGPLRFPSHPVLFARFGLAALPSAAFGARRFSGAAARALWAGMAAHAMLPLHYTATSAMALVLMLIGHSAGWPFPRGGAQRITDALTQCFLAAGGQLQTDTPVRSMRDIPSARAVLFDVTPRQLLSIAGDQFSTLYRWQLRRYRYGVGVFKIDWALDGPTPFTAETCRRAGTVHLGGTFAEIASAENAVWQGQHPVRPFVLFAQPSTFDDSRAPAGKHTAWAYCHVPHGSTVDMTNAIEDQVERFAPGFRDRILARHTFHTAQLERYNNNYVGGDINGGAADIRQLFTRPVLRASPYRTSRKGIYLCSSSTPPGGGVHGMCGMHAADVALRDIFGLRINK